MEKAENDKNSILDVDYNDSFKVVKENLLDDPKAMQLSGFSKINLDVPSSENGQPKLLDVTKIGDGKKTIIAIMLRYFEYVYIAYVKFPYLEEMLRGGLTILDAFNMIKHHLRVLLNRDIKIEETIVEMHISYYAYVKY